MHKELKQKWKLNRTQIRNQYRAKVDVKTVAQVLPKQGTFTSFNKRAVYASQKPFQASLART